MYRRQSTLPALHAGDGLYGTESETLCEAAGVPPLPYPTFGNHDKSILAFIKEGVVSVQGITEELLVSLYAKVD